MNIYREPFSASCDGGICALRFWRWETLEHLRQAHRIRTSWYGLRNGYILVTLVTENRRTLPAYLVAHFEAGRHIPGLFWLRPGTTIGEVVEELYLIWQLCAAEEFLDCALYLPLMGGA